MKLFAPGMKLLSVPVFAFFIVSSCATAPRDVADSSKTKKEETTVFESGYNKHPEKVKKTAVISILSDAAIIDETKDGSEVVDLAKNRRIAYETARHIVYVLKEKGFDINGSHVSSVGAWMDDDNTYLLKTEGSGSSANRTVIEAVPPLYVNHPFSDEGSRRDVLVNLHRNLIRGNQKYFTESSELGIVGDALMVIHLGGHTYYREFLQGQDESLTQGNSVFSLYMIDLKTGEIVWKEILNEKRLPPIKKNFFSLSDKVLSSFPHRW